MPSNTNDKSVEKKPSPYKKTRKTNQQWITYINISKLTANIAYIIHGLVETNRPQYGKGQQATIRLPNGPWYRTQLPGKYLANLTADDIKEIKKDTCDGKNPYLVYRETLPDNSYRIDILEKTSENDELYSTSSLVPELELVDSDPENETQEG